MQRSRPNPLQVLRAEVLLTCQDLNGTLEFFVQELGFQVESILPADDPELGVISGYGLRLRLERGAQLAPVTLRLEAELSAGQARELLAPNGTRVLLVEPTGGYVLPPLEPRFVLSRMAEANWVAGRAGMRYRDLIPGRLGGRFIASHIQIESAGEVADYVHFHRVRFQMIYCAKGWAKLVYEDQGAPFFLRAGDCVLQPPEIRHRVLEASAGLEVIEIGCPAKHETCGDPGLGLPNAELRPEREFNGQRFVRHRAELASWQAWHSAGFEARDIGLSDATAGLAGAHVLRSSGAAGEGFQIHGGEFLFIYVLAGSVCLRRAEEGIVELLAGDACVVPAGMAQRLDAEGSACELLWVSLPGQLEFKSA